MKLNTNLQEKLQQSAVGVLDMKTSIYPPSPLPTIPTAKQENVNHPNHYYGDTTYETIKVIEAWGSDFYLGNAIKYISRAGKKDKSKEIEDLQKALWYINRKIESLKQG
jgi:hypothetical protein